MVFFYNKKYILSFVATLLAPCAAFACHAETMQSEKKQETLEETLINTQVYSSDNYRPNAATNMFPAPAKSQLQHVLTLKPLDDESNYMIEIQVGKTKAVDCNKHALLGKIQQRSLKGWGYDYYNVDTITAGPSTMMACFDGALTQQFLSIQGDLMLPYDSRLPKVFYLPANSQLRYRIWQVASPYIYSPVTNE
ncbi:serine protease inhibitor ecotin [Shewanella sp.]|nr:serine protease inhibitor ecotin [Shewanella sp.]